MGYSDSDGNRRVRKFEDASDFTFRLDKVAETQGLEFKGFSVKYEPYECFMVLRFANPEGRYVQFVSSSDLGACMRKAIGQINKEGLSLKPDQY